MQLLSARAASLEAVRACTLPRSSDHSLFHSVSPPSPTRALLQLKVTFPVLQLVMSSRVDLEGEELQQFLDKQRQEEAQKEQQQQPKEEEGEQEGEGERAGQAVLSSQTTEGVAQDGKDIAMEVKEEGKQESGTGTSSIEAGGWKGRCCIFPLIAYGISYCH